MSNLINVTRCDNELILIAYQWGASFELGKIMSGNNNLVDMNLQIEEGPYQGGITVNGVNHPISKDTHYVYLAAGDYHLVAVGIDWGGPAEFNFTFNGKTYSMPLKQDEDGVVWSTDPIAFNVAAS